VVASVSCVLVTVVCRSLLRADKQRELGVVCPVTVCLRHTA
jgi:uncharacterized membrane protein